MSIANVNGEFVPLADATISVFDRGFMFADGVYEVAAVIDRHLVDNEAHLLRLKRSLGELRIESPVPLDKLGELMAELVRRNDLVEGTLYLQITRGVGNREFVFPEGTKATLVMLTQSRDLVNSAVAERGIRVITVPDIRWKRRDIKTVALVAQVMAKQAAKEAGADEAWMVEDGNVTEGGSSNAFIATHSGAIVTRKADNSILSGITRNAVLALAAEQGITLEERPFSVDEAYEATEAFLTSASTFVLPIVEIDDRKIGDGMPGPLARRLREIYLDFARNPVSAHPAAQ
ncbi:MAG: D-amino-acid transaminase [Rhizobiales bacterium]|nr:D-amino-acid transaminase [Hyphomicrobiales bacterium]